MIEVYTADIFDCPPFQMIDAGDCIRAKDIRQAKRFEPGSMKLWCRLAREATCIVDAGAQVGVYSLAAASMRTKLPIYAFEPNPDAYARLVLHARLNGFENIYLSRVALADRDGMAWLSWHERGWISSGACISVMKGENVVTVPVETRRLDSFNIVKLGNRGLMKIDVEGAEQLVITGMGTMLEDRPDIILECFSQNRADLINFQLPKDYKTWRIVESSGELVPTDGLRPANPQGENYNSFLSVRENP